MEIFFIWLFCAIAAGMIGARKGQAMLWFTVGFLFGPFGVLFALLSKGKRKPCPYCKELIHKEAAVCPRCQRDLSDYASKVMA